MYQHQTILLKAIDLICLCLLVGLDIEASPHFHLAFLFIKKIMGLSVLDRHIKGKAPKILLKQVTYPIYVYWWGQVSWILNKKNINIKLFYKSKRCLSFKAFKAFKICINICISEYKKTRKIISIRSEAQKKISIYII